MKNNIRTFCIRNIKIVKKVNEYCYFDNYDLEPTLIILLNN